MKIAQINTYDIVGGAARASYRLHRGMRQIGQDSTLLVRYKHSSDPTVHQVSNPELDQTADALDWLAIQRRYINQKRTSLSNTFFSFAYPGFDLTQLDDVLKADVINLHWIASFQSPVTLKKILALGKPVVWTLHDMWALSGGCHYSSGCNHYQSDCSVCPQLEPDSHPLPIAILADKIELLSRENQLTVVTASQWMAQCVRQSAIFQHCRIETIPYTLETDLFVPVSKAQAKQKLGIDATTFTLVAASVEERRKGFPTLLDALYLCLKNPQIQALADQGKFKLICYGQPNQQLNESGLPFLHLGWRGSDQELIEAYTAADLLILPSQEDNLPITMLEAMSCGTPVVAFDMGGIPDVIQDQITGRIVPIGDTQKLAAAIADCTLNPQACQQMGQNCRQLIEANYAMPLESKRYAELYGDLLRQRSKSGFTSVNGLKTELTPSTTAEGLFANFDPSLGTRFAQVVDPIRSIALLDEINAEQQKAEAAATAAATAATAATTLQQQNENLQTKLQEAEAKLQQAQAEVEAMKTSKFWKLREQWFRIKQRLGLPIEP